MSNIAIFASGNGTNAENLINYFKNHQSININLIVSNKKEAFVVQRAINNNINYKIISKSDFNNKNYVLDILDDNNIDFIVLAGFLLLIPEFLIQKYPKKIINIHPALLPKYGGKGMYGMHVHESVIKNNDQISGITIHYVNEKYDEGQIVFQAECRINDSDTPESLANKIHELEYRHFPKIIEKIICKS